MTVRSNTSEVSNVAPAHRGYGMVPSMVKLDNVTVVVLGGGRGSRLDPLTRMRSKPAVPLAGKYRLIDVPISNAIHSGMERIFVLTQFNSVSLHRHVTSTYKFDPFSIGFVEILAAQQTPTDEDWFQGTADAVRKNLDFVAELRGDFVLILAGDHLYRFDYRMLLADHVENGADITVAVLPCSTEEIADFGAVRVDEGGDIVEFREKPKTAEERAGMEVPPELLDARGVPRDRPYLASMGIYLFNQDVLRGVLSRPGEDFGKHVLPAAVGKRRVQAHFFQGYWRDIGTIRAFYEAHMDLVQPTPPFNFYDPDWVIYTRPRYLPASRVTGARIETSIISDGALIRDSTIEHSIIGIRSVLRQATVRNTLVMGADEEFPDVTDAPPLGVGEGSVIERAIVDKNVRIGRNVRLVNEKGVMEADGEGWFIRDGIIVLSKNSVIPDGTVV